jgi:DNA-binding IclR family transcriptional regulator
MKDTGLKNGRRSLQPGRKKQVDSVATALRILNLYDNKTPEMSLGDIAKRLGISKSRAHRLLATLCDHQFIEQDGETVRYRPGVKLLEIGTVYRNSNRFIREAQPIMRSIVEQTNTGVNLSTLVDGLVVYLVMESPPGVLANCTIPTTRTWAHSTGMGKAMLSDLSDAEVQAVIDTHGLPGRTMNTITAAEALQEELRRIRERGYAIDREEAIEGTCCVAVLIRNIEKEFVGAMSIAGFTAQMSDSVIQEYLHLLQIASQQLSVRLGPYRSPVRRTPSPAFPTRTEEAE